MNMKKLSLALSLALAAAPLLATAQDATTPAADSPAEAPASNFSWNMKLTSDYAYRGYSLSEGPAIQGGLDYAFGDSGFYLSSYASNVDFGDTDVDGDGKDDGPKIELDAYVGWNHNFSDAWNLDLSVARYSYFGARHIYGSSDYNEYIGKVSYKGNLSFAVSYADDFGHLGYSSVYYNLADSWDIGNDFNLHAAVGHSDFSDAVPGYNDWNLGVSRQFGPVNAALDYFDSNYQGPRGDAVVLSLTFGG